MTTTTALVFLACYMACQELCAKQRSTPRFSILSYICCNSTCKHFLRCWNICNLECCSDLAGTIQSVADKGPAVYVSDDGARARASCI